MEFLVGLGIVAVFIIIGLEKTKEQEDKDGYCDI